jgi:hypothetical protein
LIKKWYQKDDLIDKNLFSQLRELIEAKAIKSLPLKLLLFKDKQKDIILKELKILNLSTTTQTTILDKSDIKIKIFISIKGK